MAEKIVKVLSQVMVIRKSAVCSMLTERYCHWSPESRNDSTVEVLPLESLYPTLMASLIPVPSM